MNVMAMIRLDKFLVLNGKCSRREAKEYIRRRAVLVNGYPVQKSDHPIDTQKDIVTFLGQQLHYEKYLYYMMNKPAGYLTATTDKTCSTVFDLLTDDMKNLSLSAAGRLDKDTEGLLLFSNNGKFIHNMISPKKHVNKTYFAQLLKPASDENQKVFLQGINIDGGELCRSAQLEILSDPTEVLLTIHEGKYHQVKRMFQAVNNQVLYLKRIKIGSLLLDETLPLGSFKKLTSAEAALTGAELEEEF